MGYFAKKTFAGYKEVPGGYSDPEAEYYIETKEEYEDDIRKIRKASNEAIRAEEKAKEEIKKAINSANEKIFTYQQKAEALADNKEKAAQRILEEKDYEIAELQKQIEKIEEELLVEKNLHRNMVRIMKEKSNQKRGIRPKKNHDGYIVIESRQWTQKYKEEIWDTEEHHLSFFEDHYSAIKNGFLKIENKEVKVWKTLLQTPYDASLPLTQVKDRIEKELEGVLLSIGCEAMVCDEDNGRYQDFGINMDGYPKNGMYKWQYKANYKIGLWEIEIFTTKSIRVPEYRRATYNNTRKSK